MKPFTLIYCCCVLLFSCENKSGIQPKTTNKSTNGFILNGTIENFSPTKIYLNKINKNTIYQVDSAVIENNKFMFQGILKYPERFVLSFDSHSATIVIILENKPINILIDANSMNEPIIKGSPLNITLNSYKNTSKEIFRKIDYLYPKFQKARLQNDVKKLEEIGTELKKIENEFTNFSYDFIENNTNSFIAPIILSDQLKTSIIDTLRIKQSYQSLSNEVKKSPDAMLIATTLNLH